MQLPPLEAAINPLFCGRHSLGIVVRSAGRRAQSQGVRLLIGSKGEMLAFTKLARSPIARRILANESDVLQRFAQVPSVRETVPKTVFDGRGGRNPLLAQTPLAGRPAPLGLTPAHRQFLDSLQMPYTLRADQTSTVLNCRSVCTLCPRRALICSIFFFACSPRFRSLKCRGR